MLNTFHTTMEGNITFNTQSPIALKSLGFVFNTFIFKYFFKANLKLSLRKILIFINCFYMLQIIEQKRDNKTPRHLHLFCHLDLYIFFPG
jgi:hypothetical protein